ncbi:suppressor of lurcher protein 1-like isoform X2 [Ruditapes philippinarum]|uniref:suppressor of lurcher protein 1-like isoform X2 n=1 Tax=Ruditapes philippinarum TaxID=129788 RepID=UPI00295BEDE8|nr:suppressor of lurcher protein 1-like isoform X2 [Ruditapes philippinarum]
MKCVDLLFGTFLHLILIEAHSYRTNENRDTSAMIKKFPYIILKCNESISSKDRKNGTITSIDYPNSYSSGIICHYIFNAEGQERIQLKFTDVDLYYSAGDPDDPFGCPSQDSITVYTYEDDEEQQLEQFCGKKHPTQLMSSGQKMKVVFRSQNTQKDSNSGFRMEFSFRTDFGVQGGGIQDDRGVCSFEFYSTRASEGIFTSPNYPGKYPHNMECEYIFRGVPEKEIIVINFSDFDVKGCDNPTDSDYVEFSNFLDTRDRKLPRYCGNRPQYDPVTSDAAFFRVTFKSNNKFDATGFKGTYKFKKGSSDPDKPTTLSATPRNDRLNTGSRIQTHVLVTTCTIILFYKSVIDHLLNVF